MKKYYIIFRLTEQGMIPCGRRLADKYGDDSIVQKYEVKEDAIKDLMQLDSKFIYIVLPVHTK